MSDRMKSATNLAVLALAAAIGVVITSGGLHTEQDVQCGETVLMGTVSQHCTLVQKKMLGPWTWSTTERTAEGPKLVTVGVYK